MFGKSTIVTMFFNLKKLKDRSNSTRPLEFYLENGMATMSLPYPMIIFCDEETYEMTKTMRDQALNGQTNVPTHYVIKNITEYDLYKDNWDIIDENRKKSNWYKSPDERNIVSYFILTMFKITALLMSKQLNLYNTHYFAWIDFGCGHVVNKVAEYAPKMLENPNPKISICYIHYRGKDELHDMCKYMENGGPCGIACTAFTVETTYINRLYNAMTAIFHEMLFNGVGHSEETAITYCYDRHPDLFTIYYGDYYSVLTNYHKPQEDLWSIRWYFINSALQCGRLDLAKDAATKILDAIPDKPGFHDQNLIRDLSDVTRKTYDNINLR